MSVKYNWLDEICSHMINKKYKNGLWNNKEKCRKFAMLFLTRSQFKNNYNCAYRESIKNKWLDEFFPKR